MMRWIIIISSMLAVLVGAATLSGCNTPAGYEVRGGSVCKLGTDGRCYHVGDTWSAVRFDNQFRAHRVK
jgi:hypothetical protein